MNLINKIILVTLLCLVFKLSLSWCMIFVENDVFSDKNAARISPSEYVSIITKLIFYGFVPGTIINY